MINKKTKNTNPKTQKTKKKTKNTRAKTKNKNKPRKFKSLNQKEEERKGKMGNGKRGEWSPVVSGVLRMEDRSAQFESSMNLVVWYTKPPSSYLIRIVQIYLPYVGHPTPQETIPPFFRSPFFLSFLLLSG